MDTARIKDAIAAALPLPAEVSLALAGLVCYLGTCATLRRPLTWPWALAPGFALSVLIEAVDIWNHWGGSALSGGKILPIVGRHLTDVALMNLPASAIALAAVWRARRVRRARET